MDNKKEGIKDTHGDGLTSLNSSIVVKEVDDQISSVEDQLKKAQETLGQLQDLKIKLEEDRKRKQEQEKKQQQILDAVEENTKLKSEIKSYQSEINSLKNMISSLKEDLEISSEQLQKKVSNSLKILAEADANLNGKTTKIEEIKSQEEKTDIHVSKVEEVLKQQPQTQTEEVNNPVHEDPASKTEPEKISTQPPESVEDEETISIEDELNEYKRIKEELSALESGELPSESPTLTQSQENPKIDENPPPPPSPISEPPKSTDHPTLPPETSKPAPTTSTDGTTTIPVKVTTSPKDTDVDSAKAPSETQPAKSSVEQSENQQSETKNQKDQTEVKKDEPKPRKFLFFKLKDKKPKNEAKDNPTQKSEEKTEDIKEDKTGTKPTAKADGSGGMLMKTAVLLLILFLGGIAYQIKNAEKTRQTYISQVKGQVKGAKKIITSHAFSSDPTNIPKEEKYKEAFSDTAYKNTNWVVYENPEFGIKIEYPKNTSNLYQPVDSTSIWFLRKSGYLMKIDQNITNLSLDPFIKSQKNNIEYTSESTTFKGFNAVLLKQNEYLEVQGNIYYVKAGNSIYKIWYKIFKSGEEVDDEQRVAHMLETLQFTQATPPPAKKARK